MQSSASSKGGQVTKIDSILLQTNVERLMKMGYSYIWSDGLCYNISEPVYEEAPRCDPSYPDVCVASYPPDLDCDEISYTNFRVYQPDPMGLMQIMME